MMDLLEPVIVSDKSHAAAVITERLLNLKLIMHDGGSIYVKKNDLWTNDKSAVNDFLIVFILSANLMREDRRSNTLKLYSGFYRNVRACIPLVKAMVQQQTM